jgi:hypothetical protein
MFDLRDDGTIGIDFEITPENEGDPTTRTIVVKAPPSFGAYKRLRAHVEHLNTEYGELARRLREDEAVTVAAMQTQLQSALEDGVVQWWTLVMVGDDSFKGLAEEAPPESDDWPMYLTSNDSITTALAHWKSVPLGRGGKLVPKS